MIYTGSRDRVTLPLLRWCPPELLTVLVEPHNADEYRATHPGLRLVVLDDDDRGFAYMMNAMVRQASLDGHRWFVFTDDDVTDLRVRKHIGDRFVACREADAAARLAELVDAASALRLAQLAVSFAGASWSAKKPTTEPVGAWGVHVTDGAAVEAVGGYDESLLIFNDWEMSARLLVNGHRCARTNLLSFVHKMKSMGGGAADTYARTAEVAEAARRVAARYPAAARVVRDEAHGLDEVRFRWSALTRKQG